MHIYSRILKEDCLKFIDEVKPDVWTLTNHIGQGGIQVYDVNYEIKDEDKFKIFSPDSVQWARLFKCAKTMSQTDKKGHYYTVMEADVRHCGLFTTIVDIHNGSKNVIPNGTVYYNIISGDIDATTTAMQILGDDYVPLNIEQKMYIGRCEYNGDDGLDYVICIEGTLQQISNWADNIIRAHGECKLTVTMKE